MEMMLDHGALFFREKGLGRPYVLLNGFPFGSAEFADVLEVLSWSSRAIAVDLPGIGASAKTPEASPSAIADALLFSFAKFGIDGIVFGATDIAGPVVFEILGKRPELAAGALFFNTCLEPRGLWIPRYLEHAKTKVVDLFRTDRKLTQDILEAAGDPEAIPPPLLEAGVNNLKRPARRWGSLLYARTIEALFQDYRGVLQRFRKPLRILWGGRDPLFPRLQFEAFHALLPDAHTHWEEKVGHFFGTENPGLLAQTLQELGQESWS